MSAMDLSEDSLGQISQPRCRERKSNVRAESVKAYRSR